MAIPPGATFDYTAVVPPRGVRPDTAWPVQKPDALERLLGPAPTLLIVDAGMASAPATSSVTGAVRPRVQRSRIVLTAADQFNALASSAAFHVDQGLIGSLVPGDAIRIVRNHNGGIAIAVTRGSELVAAAGSITSVPLANVIARIPRALIESALDVFRLHDPDFAFREWPVEVAIGNARSVIYTGRRDLANYCVYAEHGLFAGDIGLSECLAVSHAEHISDAVTIATAQLMDSPDALEITRW